MARGTATDKEYEHWKNDINFIRKEIDTYAHLIFKSDRSLQKYAIGSPEYNDLAHLRNNYLQKKRRKELKLIEMNDFLKRRYNPVYQHLMRLNAPAHHSITIG